MAVRHLARSLLRCVTTSNIQIRNRILPSQISSIRCFSSAQTDQNAYRDLQLFLQKEIQLEKKVQKHPQNLPEISNFEVFSNGPQVTLKNKFGENQVVVKFNVVNSLNANDLDQDANINPHPQESQPTTQLKSRPSFTVEINKTGKILSFLCSFLPSDYAAGIYQKESETDQSNREELFEDFQIDEFTVHHGEWSEKMYSSDCSVVDGELYDKLLHLLDEHGIGEGSLNFSPSKQRNSIRFHLVDLEFANQLADFATAYEHRQYINLLEKLENFVKH